MRVALQRSMKCSMQFQKITLALTSGGTLEAQVSQVGIAYTQPGGYLASAK